MFEAAVLVMTLNNGSVQLNDTRGPYQTIERCEERTSEMQASVVSMLAHAGIVAIKGKCTKNGDMVV